MTNGEKLDQVFPDGICPFSKNWLDYEYKEPTTKNNLAVEKIVDILGSYTDLDIPYKSEIAENILTKLPSVTPQEPRKGYCKDCKYFEYDSMANVDGIPLIVAHEICSKWGDGCKTRENGYCYLFEPKAD